MEPHRLLRRITQGAVQNVRFADFIALVEGSGFRLDRTSGSHHIFLHSNIDEILNVQDVRGQAKPYQVRQFLRLVERYNLKLKE